VRIENCLFRGNQGNGILVYRRVTQVVIKRCQIEHNDGYGILTVGAEKGYIALNKIKHNRLDGLGINSASNNYNVAGNYFRNNTTRNHGIVGLNATWSGTSWTPLTGLVSGRNGNQAHVEVSNSTNVTIGRNFYSK